MKLKKIKLLNTSLLLVGLSSAHLSHANAYLFPTDVLDVGKVDAQLGISKTEYEADFTQGAIEGSARTRRVTEYAQVRYGLAPKWHVGVALPYNSLATTSYENLSQSGVPLADQSDKGFKNQNVQFFAKYQWMNNATQPYSLSSAFILAPSTANHGLTYATLDVNGGLRINPSLKAFAGYAYSFTDRDDYSDSHTIRAGLYYQVHENVTFAPSLAYTHQDSTKNQGLQELSSRWDTSANLALHWRVLSNTYLIPSVSFAHLSHYQAGVAKIDSTNDALSYGLSLYRLF